MRTYAHSKPEHAAFIFSFLLFSAGCPDTQVTVPVIDSVTPEGDAASTSFNLKVEGRGFGLKSVQFDVSSREGTVEIATLALQIRRGDDVIERIDGVEVESPRVLYARVLLAVPLRTGNYDVALLEGEEILARRTDAFFVPDPNAPPDGGLPDGGDLVKDAALPDTAPDGGVDDDGGGERDAEIDDGGTPDAGMVDSGLGPFAGAFRYRRLILPNNGVEAPAGVTVEIPVPHASMLTSSTAFSPEGADLAVYQGPDRLDHQWQDAFVVGTDQLVIVARLLRDLPPGGSELDPLVLYSGDAAVQLDVDDDVFEFAERFRAVVPTTWFEANNWGHCNLDRPLERVLNPEEPLGAYCAVDASTANLSRSTLATPPQPLSPAPGPNLVYEMSLWMAGRTIDGPADILYFAYGPRNDRFDDTTDLPANAFAGFTPNGFLTFQDTDSMPRTVEGWRYPPDVIQWWRRTTLRFLPAIENATLHFRYVSTNPAASTASFSAIDDWTVRLALEPDFAPSLGPVEAR